MKMSVLSNYAREHSLPNGNCTNHVIPGHLGWTVTGIEIAAQETEIYTESGRGNQLTMLLSAAGFLKSTILRGKSIHNK